MPCHETNWRRPRSFLAPVAVSSSTPARGELTDGRFHLLRLVEPWEEGRLDTPGSPRVSGQAEHSVIIFCSFRGRGQWSSDRHEFSRSGF